MSRTTGIVIGCVLTTLSFVGAVALAAIEQFDLAVVWGVMGVLNAGMLRRWVKS